MIVVVRAISQPILLFLVAGEFQREWTVCGALLVPFGALIRGLALLTAVTIEHVHTVAIWVVALGSLRDEFDVERGKDFVHTGPDSVHVLKQPLFEETYIDSNFETILLIFALQFFILILLVLF